MQCIKPTYLSITATNMGTVPCGRCMPCRINRARDWTTRILHEFSEMGSEGTFVTLTYAEETPGMTLVKKDLQNFFKRLRKEIEPKKIKYFACGEYGDKTFRPHYHAIILGLRPYQKNIVEKAWTLHGQSLGFTICGEVNPQSINYVTGYIMKKLSGPLGLEKYGDKAPPFQIQSQGMGLSWANKNYKYLQENGNITIKGNPVGVPKYYSRKLDLDTAHLEKYIEEANKATREEYQDKHVRPLDEADYVRAKRKQIGKNIAARLSLRSKVL